MQRPRLFGLGTGGTATASLVALLFLVGCQEDSGSTAARSPDASFSAAQREGKAMNSFKRIFDQPGKSEPQPDTSPDEVAQSERPTLEWTAPLTRENGTSLYVSEIQGYRLYYRLRHEQTFRSIDVDGAENTSYALEEFKSGAYEFAITARDNDGLESRKSGFIEVDLI
ncbi:MAG: fibronectin type III domain-containing protein [Marinobacter sp.]|nr:fibronectin type III domain-containing protein [Marinobacter sp.]